MAQPRLKMRLGDLLVAEMIITDDQLQLALQQQRQTGRKLGTTLVDLGFIGEEQLLKFLAQQLNIPFFDLSKLTIQTQAARRVRQSQTVIPRSVSAARSWLLAPNRLQNIFQAGTGLPAASRVGRSRKMSGTPAVTAVPSQPPTRPWKPVSSCTMYLPSRVQTSSVS